MPGFNPQVFIWARESAGLDLEAAARALKIKEGSLAEVEAGAADPSRPLLLRMAATYRRSLLSLYLPAPPRKGNRGQDFRTVVEERAVDAEAGIDALSRDLLSRQSVVRSTLEDDEDTPHSSFVGSADIAQGVEAVAGSIAQTLGFELAAFRKQSTAEKAFGLLREKAEAAGVFVLLVGNLGSHHSAIPVEAFRGFAIADAVAPFVVINDQDARAAWSFTLLHELAHLWLGATGVSAGRAEQRIERFCNEVAAHLLAPAADLQAIDTKGLDEAALVDLVSRLSSAWNVSRPMVAYRLLRAGKFDEASWRGLDAKLREIWAGERQRERDSKRANKKKSGPSYYVVRRAKLGRAMLNFASRSIDSGALSPAKAAQVLGVAPRGVFTLLGGQG